MSKKSKNLKDYTEVGRTIILGNCMTLENKKTKESKEVLAKRIIITGHYSLFSGGENVIYTFEFVTKNGEIILLTDEDIIENFNISKLKLTDKKVEW